MMFARTFLPSIRRSLLARVGFVGPHAMPAMVHTAMGAAERVCDASEKSLAMLTPPLPIAAETSDARVAG